MEYFLNQYKTRMKQELSPYGFRLDQRTFFRVINDIVQTVSLNKNRYGCTIEYGILPLAFPVDDSACLHGGRYSIGMKRKPGIAWWPFF